MKRLEQLAYVHKLHYSIWCTVSELRALYAAYH